MRSDIMKVQFLPADLYFESHIALLYSKIQITLNCVLDIRSDGTRLLHHACEALGLKGSSAGVFNSLPWERQEVIQIEDGSGKPGLGTFDI